MKRIRQDSSELEDEENEFSQNENLKPKKIKLSNEHKKLEYIRYITVLNTSIQEYFVSQIKINPVVNLSAAAQDYIDYAKQIEDRYLRKHGEVLTFGSGDCGQLGHGVDRDEDLMVKYPRIVLALRDKKVCGIACGGLHNAVYTDSGQVYTWGCADDGSLGRIGDESMPILVKDLFHETIVSVACGDGQTLALTAKGEVYGWGCYKDKEGKKWFHPKPDTPNPLKDIKKQQDVPMKIHPLNDITTIVCGSSFCLAKTSTGYVYSWGISECGEIGRYCPDLKILGKNEDGESDMIYDTNSILKYHLTPDFMRQIIDNSNDISSKSNIPTKDTVFNKYTSNHLSDVKIIENVKTIGCGSYHSFVIVVGNQVYSCGLNNYAQLGFLDTDSRYLLQKVPSLSNKGLVDAKGGVHHSLVLSYDNKLYSFGRGDSGQLGVKELENKSPGAFSDKALLVRFLTKINNDYEIISYSCGGNHNLALTSDNEVYTWGYGDMLALGHGEDKDETVPKKLNLSKSKVGNITVAQVAGGGQHSAIIGEVLSTS